jgi:hypothetical protein
MMGLHSDVLLSNSVENIHDGCPSIVEPREEKLIGLNRNRA